MEVHKGSSDNVYQNNDCAKALLEKETDKGRIDAVLELPNKVYIIEFKFATTTKVKQVATLSKRALKQIKDKNIRNLI